MASCATATQNNSSPFLGISTRHSKYLTIALTIGAFIGGMIMTLGAAQICGPIGSTGFITSVISGGLIALISIGGLISLALKNCKRENKEEDFSENPLYKKWFGLLIDRKGSLLPNTNVPKFAVDFVKELTCHNVPIEGYEKLMVWYAEMRSCPGVFKGSWSENIASSMNPQKFKTGSILLIVVIPTWWGFEEAKRSIFERNCIMNAWEPNFPVILHFTQACKPFFDDELKIALTPQQCQQIAQHQGERPPQSL